MTALGAIGPEAAEALPAVIKTLADPAHPVRCAASVALGKIGAAAKVAVPVLEQNLRDADPYLQLASAWALAHLDPGSPGLAERCLGPLRWGLKSSDAQIRREGAQALGRLGPPARSAVADLALLASDPDEGVRKAATNAIEAIGRTTPRSGGKIERNQGARSGDAK